MDRFLIIAGGIAVILAMLAVAPFEGAVSLLTIAPFVIAALVIFNRYSDEKEFITRIFLIGLIARLAFGIIVHYFDLRDFFGGDAITYDFRGNLLLKGWEGFVMADDPEYRIASSMSGTGWGMYYFVAAIYFFVGKNILAAQSVCAVFGAATSPLAYICARKIFNNTNVAKFSAVAIALFPSFIIWSGQLMKDGLITFLLVLVMTMVLHLQERLSYSAVILLFLSVGGILALRFYIFYLVGIAVVGSFLIGTSNSAQSVLRRSVVLVVLGLGLTYFGVTRTATVDLNKYGDLKKLQLSRLDQAQTAKSGFSEDTDISTTQGAIAAIPVGFVYLMLAPFPWQMASLRQSITLPEVVVWWGMIPIMSYGLWWTLRNRLRAAFPILIFSLMLTLAYSIFQGNVGTAYRQRTQIQVFLFMFIGVGWQIYKEKQEDKKLLKRRRPLL